MATMQSQLKSAFMYEILTKYFDIITYPKMYQKSILKEKVRIAV